MSIRRIAICLLAAALCSGQSCDDPLPGGAITAPVRSNIAAGAYAGNVTSGGGAYINGVLYQEMPTEVIEYGATFTEDGLPAIDEGSLYVGYEEAADIGGVIMNRKVKAIRSVISGIAIDYEVSAEYAYQGQTLTFTGTETETYTTILTGRLRYTDSININVTQQAATMTLKIDSSGQITRP